MYAHGPTRESRPGLSLQTHQCLLRGRPVHCTHGETISAKVVIVVYIQNRYCWRTRWRDCLTPQGAINRAPTPRDIASLAVRGQFASGIQNIFNTNVQERKLANPDLGLYQRYTYHKMYCCVNIQVHQFTSPLLLTYSPRYFREEGLFVKQRWTILRGVQVFMKAKRATARNHYASGLEAARLIVWLYRRVSILEGGKMAPTKITPKDTAGELSVLTPA